MSGSSNKVNYNVRTSKSIERKMMCEAISCLSHVGSVSDYRYIGLGAKYFVDFVLMHKTFGITDMYSLETTRSENDKARFEFNKPFDCISLHFKNSTEWLNSTTVKLKEKEAIIWFDYDSSFNQNQITDISLCVKKVKTKSLVFVTTSLAFVEEMTELSPDEKVSFFSRIVDNENYTRHFSKKSFAGITNITKSVAEVFNLAVKDAICDINKVKSNPSQIMYADQIVCFDYADSKTKMITLGWIVYNEFDSEAVKKCGFDKLSFYKQAGEDSYSIFVPNFTYKELAVLNKNMPNGQYPIEEAKFLTKEEIDEYKKIYRYYPTTIETAIVL